MAIKLLRVHWEWWMEMCEGLTRGSWANGGGRCAPLFNIRTHLLCAKKHIHKHIAHRSRPRHSNALRQTIPTAAQLPASHYTCNVDSHTGETWKNKKATTSFANDLLRSSFSGWSKILIYTMTTTTPTPTMQKLRNNSVNDIGVAAWQQQIPRTRMLSEKCM